MNTMMKSLLTTLLPLWLLMFPAAAFVVAPTTKRQHLSRPPLALWSPSTTTAVASAAVDQQQTHQQMPANNNVHAPIVEIQSEQQFKDFLAQDDRICVIKFHAAWCKSCQKFGLKYQGLANEMTDWVENNNGNGNAGIAKQGQIRMGAVEFGANKELCKSLGIKRLPTVHFYQHGKKLAGFPCGPAKFPLVQETIQHYLSSQKSESELEDKLNQGNALMNGSYNNNYNGNDQKQPESSQEGGSFSYEQQLAQAYATSSSPSAEPASKKKSWWSRG